MKEVISFLKKEFLHIFRDKRTILIVLVMPVVQIILFGYAVSTEIYNIRVDIAGDMSDPLARKIAERIDNNRYLTLGQVLDSPSRIEERFRKNLADAAVILGRNLSSESEAEIRIVGDGSDPNTAQMTVNYIRGAITQVFAGNTARAQVPIQLMYNPSMRSSYNFVPGVIGLILMLICSMMTAISIVREKESGTMELLLVSPVRPIWIIISKAAPYMVLSIVNFVSILLLSYFVMDVPVRGSLLLLSVSALIFIIASLAIGLLISVVSPTQKTALLISGMGLTMPTIIFSGIIFPCESMPQILQWISHLIPAKWFIIIVKKIMIQGVGLAYILKELAILSAMTAALLTLSIKTFKTRL